MDPCLSWNLEISIHTIQAKSNFSRILYYLGSKEPSNMAFFCIFWLILMAFVIYKTFEAYLSQKIQEPDKANLSCNIIIRLLGWIRLRILFILRWFSHFHGSEPFGNIAIFQIFKIWPIFYGSWSHDYESIFLQNCFYTSQGLHKREWKSWNKPNMALMASKRSIFHHIITYNFLRKWAIIIMAHWEERNLRHQ